MYINIKMATSKDTEKFCEACKKDFNGEKAVGCEGMYASWFHIQCSGPTTKQLQALDSCDSLKWLCPTCVKVNLNRGRTAENEQGGAFHQQLSVAVKEAIREKTSKQQECMHLDLCTLIQTAVKAAISGYKNPMKHMLIKQ